MNTLQIDFFRYIILSYVCTLHVVDVSQHKTFKFILFHNVPGLYGKYKTACIRPSSQIIFEEYLIFDLFS